MKTFQTTCMGLVARRDALIEDADLAAINRYALKPVERENVAVFTIEVCHDQVDKHFSRFPKEELETIARLVPGRPLMLLHDIRTKMPLGKIFRGWLALNDQHTETEHYRSSVQADVYVLRTAENASAIENIEGGVWAETSIGFSFRLPECSICNSDLRSCDHQPGRTYEGRQCHYIMREVLEVIETSLVPSGSQGTEVLGSRSFEAALLEARGAVSGEEKDAGVTVGMNMKLLRKRHELMGNRWPGWAVKQ